MNLVDSWRARFFAIWLCCFAIASSAFAAETIKVNRSAIYRLTTSSSTKMQDRCELDTQIIDSLVRYSKGRVEITDKDLSQVEGPTLLIVITDAFAAGGGGWSGPKWAYVRAILKQGDQVIDQFEVGSQTGGGGHITACGALGKVGKALGAKVAKRLLRSEKKKASSVVADHKDDERDAEDTEAESEQSTP